MPGVLQKVKSILQEDLDYCFICGRNANAGLEYHHIFGGADRKKSDRLGLVVRLCHECHNEPPEGVHHNEGNNRRLQREAQQAFERLHGHDEFIKIFGRNYDH